MASARVAEARAVNGARAALARARVPATPLARAADRWLRPGAGERQRAGALAAILVGSVLVHAAFVTAALVTAGRPPPTPVEEIPVEVVQDQPSAPADTQAATDEPAKPEPAKQELAKQEPAKQEPVKQESVKQESEPPPKPPDPPVQASAPQGESQPELKPVLPPEPPPQPAAAPAPAGPAKAAAEPPAPKADELAELKALRDELAGLKAESAALGTAEQDEEAAAAGTPAGTSAGTSGLATGFGPLPSSFQAVALPGETEGEGEATSYEALVFSRLAKAKELGGHLGEPGSAGVQFAIDTRGALVSVRVVASSGIKSLDEEALALVRKAAPFPTPPDGKGRSISANVSFVAAR